MKALKLALLLILIEVILCHSAKTQEQVQPKAGSTSEHQEAESTTLPVTTSHGAVEAPITERATNQHQAQADQKLTRYDKLSLAAQYLIFLATLIYAWIANRQLKAIDTSAKAAELSAHAAIQNKRPLMVIDEVTLGGFAEPPSPSSTIRNAVCRFRFKNRGESIAVIKNIDACLGFKNEFKWREDGLPEQLENVLYFDDHLVYPEQPTRRFRLPFTYGLVIDEARRHEMATFGKELEFRGRIDYMDMAKQDRWTTFAWSFKVDAVDPTKGEFWRLPDGNDYDVYPKGRYGRYKQSEQPTGIWARTRSFFARRRVNRRSRPHRDIF